MLYGTTLAGGKYGHGTVFAVTAAGEERVLHSFGGAGDGASPLAALVDVNGVLYGTTYIGGKYSYGAVFAMTPAGDERLLYSFDPRDRVDGYGPEAALIDVNGVLYGTTCYGGKYGPGTVFSLTTAGDERILHNFSGADGERPCTSLTDVNGVLYGMTLYGGKYGYGDDGTVFDVTTTGVEHVLHNFGSGPYDGLNPQNGALTDVNGVLYGTTPIGGKYGRTDGGYGTVFAVRTDGVERVLYSFAGGEDGAIPVSADLVDVNGVLYGTTSQGGKYKGGTVFAVTAAGKERVLHSFGAGEDGSDPVAGLIYVNGVLYGTTELGGKYKDGTVFAVNTAGSYRVLHSFAGPS
jgi:uncharacterized repeat protein (TIGR03803 family)